MLPLTRYQAHRPGKTVHICSHRAERVLECLFVSTIGLCVEAYFVVKDVTVTHED